MKAETKYKGSIKLSAIGDALGWITEFEKNQSSIYEKYQVERIEAFYDWKKIVGGRFYGYVDNIKAGSYSDDTQLMLSVARSIGKDGNVDHVYFAKTELANWLDYSRGGGRTVKTAADKISRKSVNWFSNFYSFKVNGEYFDYRQSGANGAAMRVLPIALANLGNFEKIKEEIFCNSIITHGHPRAIIGAILYGYAVNQIIIYRPEDFSWEGYITQLGTDIQSKLAISYDSKNEIRQWLIEWNKGSTKKFEDLYDQTLIEAQNQLRIIFQNIKKSVSVFETLKSIGCLDPSTKGSGVSTVIAGIYLASKFYDNPLDAIIEAVNALGTDTDSIAAFSGGLIGALHGQNIIPTKWKGVQDAPYLESIAERLLAISEDRFDEIISEPILVRSNKLLNKIEVDNFSLEEVVNFIPLGTGRIRDINRQPTLTKGKYNLILDVLFDAGQSIILTKLFDDPIISSASKNTTTSNSDELIILAESLKPSTRQALLDYLKKEKKIPQRLVELLKILIQNKD